MESASQGGVLCDAALRHSPNGCRRASLCKCFPVLISPQALTCLVNEVPAFSAMAAEFARPISDIAKLNGDLVLALGISSFASIILSNMWGKRPVYLLSVLAFFAGCCWAASCTCLPAPCVRVSKLTLVNASIMLQPLRTRDWSVRAGSKDSVRAVHLIC